MATARILGLSGNITKPSRTSSLVHHLLDSSARQVEASTSLVEIADLIPDFADLLGPSANSTAAWDVIQTIEAADALVVASPVYKASYTGGLKYLLDFLTPDALAGKPVMIAATGGSANHALVTEHLLRPLFGFFNAQVTPTTVYALESDFDGYRLASAAIEARAARATAEFARAIAIRQGVPLRQASPALSS